MLDKLKYTMIVGLVLSALRIFMPDLPIPEGFEETINSVISGAIVIVSVVVGWFTRESRSKVVALETVP